MPRIPEEHEQEARFAELEQEHGVPREVMQLHTLEFQEALQNQQQAQERQAQERQERTPSVEQKGHGDLSVLFSHSARIRCFLDMLFPLISPKDNSQAYYSEESIYTLMKGEKFNNCVFFRLVKITTPRDDDLMLSMIHPGPGERIDFTRFAEKLEIQTVDNQTMIRVQINEGKVTQAPGIPSIRTTEYVREFFRTGKTLYIIRHGQSTHNLGKNDPRNHLTKDTSLTQTGINEAKTVAEATSEYFSGYEKITIYVSELWRTQQTAMYFFQTVCEKLGERLPGFISRDPSMAQDVRTRRLRRDMTISPIQLYVVPCNHEFHDSDNNMKNGACYVNQAERSSSYSFLKKENLPESNPTYKDPRKFVMVSISVPSYTPGKGALYFYLNEGLYSQYAECNKTVFHYLSQELPKIPGVDMDGTKSIDSYKDIGVVSTYNLEKGEYKAERINLLVNPMKKIRNWTEDAKNWYNSRGGYGGGRSSRGIKKKRRTIRRKTNRSTKKRNIRRTNKKKRFTKKRFTQKRNSRRTNKKKRYTKRR